MPKFPEPPAAEELRQVPAAEKILEPGTLLWRIYRRGGSQIAGPVRASGAYSPRARNAGIRSRSNGRMGCH